MPSSPDLDDRIRSLCDKAVTADQTNLQSVMSELRAVLREQVDNIRTLAVQQMAGERSRGDKK